MGTQRAPSLEHNRDNTMGQKHQTRSALRLAAEAQLEDATPKESPESSQALVHELQVNQIEMEMQNEALRQAQHEL